MSKEIDILIEKGLIEKTKGDYIREKFQDFTQAVEEWSEKANAIVVTDETQKESMLEAREGRLLLKAKRIEIEKVRKSLKEQSLNEGRLIDSVAKYLTGLIEPAEKHLELQEKFIEIQDQNKRIKLKADRTELLQPYKEVIDPNSIQLDLITEEAFTTILNGAKFSLENKKAEALRVEQERLENDRKQKLFQERRLQIVEYKQFYNSETDLVLTTETGTLEFNMLLQNLIFRHGQEIIRQDEIKKQNEALKKQNEKNAEQIKKLKKEIKQTPTAIPEPIQPPALITKINLPSTAELSHKPAEYLESQNENIIMVNRSEYETLKKRYSIAKTALESVLYFIVPQNLRDLINKAMLDIKEAEEFKETF
jgi:hypothetical protein